MYPDNQQITAGKYTARAAGLMYLFVVVTGIFSLAYIPQKLINWNSAETTYNNIKSSPFLFRLGIYSSILCYVAFTFLPLLLYKLLRAVSEWHAVLMVILALLSVPLSFNNLQHKYAVLKIIENESSLQHISAYDLQRNLMACLYQYNDGVLLATVFWGLWLFPFGWLVYRSGFLPKLLGILLMLGCVGYLLNFTGNTLLENYAQIGLGTYFSKLPAAAEIGTCLWLLFFGVQKRKK